ncbi:ATP-binding protein [Solwaraspora sp. WMMB335]|uniref:ATP-binding protein n=1 Tax=Solwaraspora sp. WMMB335 TaxID=3404118 RepID=UPI003B95DB2A
MSELDAVASLPQMLAELDLLRRHAATGTGKLRLSLSDIAKASGIPRSTLASYLNGSTLITADALDSVVLALGVTPHEARRWATAWERISAGPRTPPAVPVPHQVPADVVGFVGRAAELAVLGGPPVTVISGLAGVGKSALAIRFAHQVVSRFPDGQLYLDLRGYDPALPLDADSALDCLLRSLGASVPAGIQARASAYRSLLNGRRMLVILDNARSAEQVRPLLPGSAGNTTIVTSRDSLPGLVARDGARRLVLDALTEAQAYDLLAAMLGTGRITQRDASELNRLCAGLPLALRVAAERIGAHPARTPAGLIEEIARCGLDALDAGGDPLVDVRTVFSWSYAALSAPAARMFRLLGLVPGPSVAEPAVACLADTTVETARRAMDELVRAHMVTAVPPVGFRQHDLLKLYASELACTDPMSSAARARLLDFYLGTASAAMNFIAPHERHLRPPAPASTYDFRDKANALSWLDTERAGVLAAVDTAPDAYVHRLAATIWRYLDTGGHYTLGLRLHSRARLAARAQGEPVAEAIATGALSLAEFRLGHHERAMYHARIAARVDDPGIRGLMIVHLAVLHLGAARPLRALATARQALTLLERAGDRASAAVAMSNIATAHERLGYDEPALEYYRRARDTFRELDNLAGVGHAIASLANLHARRGAHASALANHEQALALFQAVGYADGRAAVLWEMARLHARMGDIQSARTLFDGARAARHAIDQAE